MEVCKNPLWACEELKSVAARLDGLLRVVACSYSWGLGYGFISAVFRLPIPAPASVMANVISAVLVYHSEFYKVQSGLHKSFVPNRLIVHAPIQHIALSSKVRFRILWFFFAAQNTFSFIIHSLLFSVFKGGFGFLICLILIYFSAWICNGIKFV